VAIAPGEAISLVSLMAVKLPFAPTALGWLMVVLLSAAALSKDGNDGPPGEAPKDTLAWRTPVLL
jgi:hypothetical protein